MQSLGENAARLSGEWRGSSSAFRLLCRVQNIALCKGWSFAFDEESREVSRLVVLPEEPLTIAGNIVNDGARLGTVYVRVQIARSHLASTAYHNGTTTFDTHRDLDVGAKSALRVIDIGVGARKAWSVSWVALKDLAPGHFDYQVEVWNPPKLFDTPGAHLFHRTRSFGGFEVLDPRLVSHKYQTFISYSHDSAEHERWTLRLAEQLMKFGIPSTLDNKDAEPGDRFDRFMSSGIEAAPVILLICSARFVAKAEAYEGGVGFEMRRIEQILGTDSAAVRVIPIVRNNTENKLPSILGTFKALDLSDDNWTASVTELARVIKGTGRD